MDPFTITTGVVALAGSCIGGLQTIQNNIAKYDIAEIKIWELRSECQILYRALKTLETLSAADQASQPHVQNRASDTHLDDLKSLPDLFQQCDHVFKDLQIRLEPLLAYTVKEDNKMTGRSKVAAVWRDGDIQQHIFYVHGLMASAHLLLTLHQVESHYYASEPNLVHKDTTVGVMISEVMQHETHSEPRIPQPAKIGIDELLKGGADSDASSVDSDEPREEKHSSFHVRNLFARKRVASDTEIIEGGDVSEVTDSEASDDEPREKKHGGFHVRNLFARKRVVSDTEVIEGGDVSEVIGSEASDDEVKKKKGFHLSFSTRRKQRGQRSSPSPSKSPSITSEDEEDEDRSTLSFDVMKKPRSLVRRLRPRRPRTRSPDHILTEEMLPAADPDESEEEGRRRGEKKKKKKKEKKTKTLQLPRIRGKLDDDDDEDEIEVITEC